MSWIKGFSLIVYKEIIKLINQAHPIILQIKFQTICRGLNQDELY